MTTLIEKDEARTQDLIAEDQERTARLMEKAAFEQAYLERAEQSAVQRVDDWFDSQLDNLKRSIGEMEKHKKCASDETSLKAKADRIQWAMNVLQQQLRGMDNGARFVGELNLVHGIKNGTKGL